MVVGFDMGDPMGDRQAEFTIPVTSDHCILGMKHEVACGPSLQDDIERMVAENGAYSGIHEVPHDVVPASGTVDEWLGTIRKAEFLSRLPCDGSKREPKFNSPCTLLPVELSNTPEPPAEPETVAEAPAASQRAPRESDQARAVRLWGQYLARHPDKSPQAIVSMVRSHLKKLTVPQVRELLRTGGVDVPDPMTIEQTAANARAAQQAKAQSRSLIERFPDPPLNLGALDALALTFELLDEDHPQVSSFYVAKCGKAAIEEYGTRVLALRDEFRALPPYKRTELKSALGAKWKSGSVAA